MVIRWSRKSIVSFLLNTSLFWLVPVPGETLVTFEIKNYSHKKYSPCTLISVYCGSVQSTHHTTPQTKNKFKPTMLMTIIFPQAWVWTNSRRVIHKQQYNNNSKIIIESSIVVYIDSIAWRGGGVWSARIKINAGRSGLIDAAVAAISVYWLNSSVPLLMLLLLIDQLLLLLLMLLLLYYYRSGTSERWTRSEWWWTQSER